MKFPWYFNRSSGRFGDLGTTAVLRNPWFSSLLITLLLLGVQLLFFRPYFLVNDDVFKVLMTKGVGTNNIPSGYFGHSNVLLGFLFKTWFSWFPSIPWYGYFLVTVQAVSLWAFLGILRQKHPDWIHTVFFVIACLGVHSLFFTFLQFTMTALMAAQAGLWLFCHSFTLKDRRKNTVCLTAAGTLLLLSSLIRLESFLLMLLVSAPFLFFISRDRRPIDSASPQWKFIGLTVLAIAAGALFDHAWMQRNGEWKDYERFDKARHELHEYRAVEHTPATQPLFDSVGWSKNDFSVFRRWFFMDLEKFQTGKIEKLSAALPRTGPEGKGASFSSLHELFGSFWDGRMLLFFLFFLVFCGAREIRFLLVQFLWIVMIFLYLLYFMKATDRVTLPVLAFLVNLAVYHSSRLPWGEGERGSFLPEPVRRRAGIALVAGALLFTAPTLKNYHIGNMEQRKVEARMGNALDRLPPGKDRLYVMWAFPFEAFSAFDNFERFRPYRIFVTSFFQRSPVAMEVLKDFRVGNLFRDMVDNPQIFLNCTGEQGVLYHDYLRENFHKVIRAKKVFDSEFFKVYSIHSAGKRSAKRNRAGELLSN